MLDLDTTAVVGESADKRKGARKKNQIFGWKSKAMLRTGGGGGVGDSAGPRTPTTPPPPPPP